MIFQSLMGLGKSRCDVLSGTTQGWVCCLCLVMDMFTLIFIRSHILRKFTNYYYDIVILFF
jgi:hypothetical protein